MQVATILGCPFGCRQAHRREGEIKRSREYYRSKEGKIKKSYLNARRKQNRTAEQSAENETRAWIAVLTKQWFFTFAWLPV